MIMKNYVTLSNGRQSHYRSVEKAGADTTVVMLHPSPMSSEMMVPIMKAVEGVCNIVAADTPGYGQSDPLTEEALNAADDLSPYVDWLADFISSLNLDNVVLYGSATGAQIAIEFARLYPEKLKSIVLDNAADFSEEECVEAMEHYFPDLSPKADGSHLQKIWEISDSLFKWFPWYQQNDEHLVSSEGGPVAAINATAKAYFVAGPAYSEAYKRAFVNEKAIRLQGVTVPAIVIRWAGSIVKSHSDRLDNYEWPSNIQMLHCGTTIDDRMSAIRQAISEQI